MLKGGSLIFALIISLLVALISSSFIMLSFHDNLETESRMKLRKLRMNVESGLTLLLSQQLIINPDQTVTMDLFGEGSDSVTLSRKSWGAFEIISSKAFGSGDFLEKRAIAGFEDERDTALALVLSDLDRPLSLCGKTILKGTCYVPKAGFQRAYIEGKNFEGLSFVTGTTMTSTRDLPRFNKDLYESLLKGFSPTSYEDSLVSYDESGIPDSADNSFLHKTLCYFSETVMVLQGQMLSGNIRIISQREIRVGKDCRLKDIILFAPKIIFEKGFEGSVQAFACDSLFAGDETKFMYPSVLGVIRAPRSSDGILLSLGEKTIVQGSVFGYEDKYDARKQVILSLGVGSEITGSVYCQGSLDLKGSVYGTVMCSKFLLKTRSAVYENHLLDATIDRSRRPKEFPMANITMEDQPKKIMKWL